MRTAIASFPRSPGELRVELDVERRGVVLAFYVPQLGAKPHLEKSITIPVREIDEIVRALHDGKGQIIALRMREGSGA